MGEFFNEIELFFDRLVSVIFSYNILTDTLDIALVAFLIYQAIKMLKETRGIQIVKGLLLVGVVYFIISMLGMQASTYLFETLLGDLIIVLIILFSPEIRHALETMGRKNLAFLNFFGAQQGDAMYERKKTAVLEICKACNEMSKRRIGALLVFERETMLGDVVKTGTLVDAKVTKEIIESLFFPNSPLHDGGVVIRDGRVCAAGCILPLTENILLNSQLGTRHRAALGMSEKSDAIVVVVSEETGVVSIACDGVFERDITDGILIERLMGYVLPGKDVAKGTFLNKIFSLPKKIKERSKK